MVAGFPLPLPLSCMEISSQSRGVCGEVIYFIWRSETVVSFEYSCIIFISCRTAKSFSAYCLRLCAGAVCINKRIIGVLRGQCICYPDLQYIAAHIRVMFYERGCAGIENIEFFSDHSYPVIDPFRPVHACILFYPALYFFRSALQNN